MDLAPDLCKKAACFTNTDTEGMRGTISLEKKEIKKLVFFFTDRVDIS